MSIASYSDLQTAILNWSDRSDLAASVPDFIVLAEAIFNNGDGDPGDPAYIAPIRTRDMETTEALTMTSGAAALPSGFLEPRRVYTTLRELTYVPPTWYQANYPSGQSTDPAYYTILGSSLYAGTDVTLDYYAAIGPLASAAGGTNWLLQRSPNAYLHGGLFQLYVYMKNAESAVAQRGLMAAAIAGVAGRNTASRAVLPQRRSSMVAF